MAVGLLVTASFLFSLEPPLFWQGSIYGLLWMSGLGPHDNDPTWITFVFMYGFQTLVFLVLLVTGVIWVFAAPARVAEEIE